MNYKNINVQEDECNFFKELAPGNDESDNADMIDKSEVGNFNLGFTKSKRKLIFKTLLEKSNKRLSSVYEGICKKYGHLPDKESESFDLAEVIESSKSVILKKIIPDTIPVIDKPEYQFSDEELKMYELLSNQNLRLQEQVKSHGTLSSSATNCEFINLAKEQRNIKTDSKQGFISPVKSAKGTIDFVNTNQKCVELAKPTEPNPEIRELNCEHNIERIVKVKKVSKTQKHVKKSLQCKTAIEINLEEPKSAHEVCTNILTKKEVRTRNKVIHNNEPVKTYNLRRIQIDKSNDASNFTLDEKNKVPEFSSTDVVSDCYIGLDQSTESSDKLEPVEGTIKAGLSQKKNKMKNRTHYDNKNSRRSYCVRSFKKNNSVYSSNFVFGERKKSPRSRESFNPPSLLIYESKVDIGIDIKYNRTSKASPKCSFPETKLYTDMRTFNNNGELLNLTEEQCFSSHSRTMKSSNQTLSKSIEPFVSDTPDSTHETSKAKVSTRIIQNSLLSIFALPPTSTAVNEGNTRTDLKGRELSHYLSFKSQSLEKPSSLKRKNEYYVHSEHSKSLDNRSILIQSQSGLLFKRAPWTRIQTVK